MVTYPDTPVLIDKFIIEFNAKMASQLAWLNNPLGKIQEISKHLENRYVRTPAMHTEYEEWIEVFPNDQWVNYSWFNFGPEQINGIKSRVKIKIKADFNLFLNLNKIYPSVTQSRNIENAKRDIYNALNRCSLLSAAIRINTISESFKDVYRGFNINDIADKYFMQPYAGLNFSMDIYLRNICYPDLWTADSNTIDASGTNWDASGAIF
jgi:hypothetical protein